MAELGPRLAVLAYSSLMLDRDSAQQVARAGAGAENEQIHELNIAAFPQHGSQGYAGGDGCLADLVQGPYHLGPDRAIVVLQEPEEVENDLPGSTGQCFPEPWRPPS